MSMDQGGSEDTRLSCHRFRANEVRPWLSRQRIMHRYGLTPRLMELTDCIAANLGDAEIVTRMGLTDKPALRRFASDLTAG
jgi:hypothetical protein